MTEEEMEAESYRKEELFFDLINRLGLADNRNKELEHKLSLAKKALEGAKYAFCRVCGAIDYNRRIEEVLKEL